MYHFMECFSIGCFSGRKMERYWHSFLCGDKLYFDTIKIVFHARCITSPFLAFQYLTFDNTHVMTHSNRKRINNVLHFTTNVFVIGANNVKELVQQITKLM